MRRYTFNKMVQFIRSARGFSIKMRLNVIKNYVISEGVSKK